VDSPMSEGSVGNRGATCVEAFDSRFRERFDDQIVADHMRVFTKGACDPLPHFYKGMSRGAVDPELALQARRLSLDRNVLEPRSRSHGNHDPEACAPRSLYRVRKIQRCCGVIAERRYVSLYSLGGEHDEVGTGFLQRHEVGIRGSLLRGYSNVRPSEFRGLSPKCHLR